MSGHSKWSDIKRSKDVVEEHDHPLVIIGPDGDDPLAVVLMDVALERGRQDVKFPEQGDMPDGTNAEYWASRRDFARRICDGNAEIGIGSWLDILREEVYEAFSEEDPAKLREELVQVAAVAVKWVEYIDRRSS